MIFGLMCGLLIFMTAVMFMNAMYMSAAVGAGLGGLACALRLAAHLCPE